MRLYDAAVEDFLHQNIEPAKIGQLLKLYRSISKLTKQSQANHMDRMRGSECSATQGLVFVEVLNSLARVGGHSINVAQSSVAEQ